MNSAAIILLLTGLTIPGICAEPWNKPFERWTDADARRVLSASPWTRAADGTWTVRWESALPVQYALTRTGLQPVSDRRDCYVIAVIGNRGAPREAVQPDAWLRYSGGEALRPVEIRVLERADGLPATAFLFLRSHAGANATVFRLPGIVLNPKAFEFSVRLGSLAIRQKFPVTQMLYLGRVEL